MPLSLAFWILMLIWLVLGLIDVNWSAPRPAIGSLLLFLIIALLGAQVFGAPLRG